MIGQQADHKGRDRHMISLRPFAADAAMVQA
jgi:hypothetical protein